MLYFFFRQGYTQKKNCCFYTIGSYAYVQFGAYLKKRQEKTTFIHVFDEHNLFLRHVRQQQSFQIHGGEEEEEEKCSIAPLLPPISRRMTSVPSHLDKPPMNQHFPLKYRVHRVGLQAEHKDRRERGGKREREWAVVCVSSQTLWQMGFMDAQTVSRLPLQTRSVYFRASATWCTAEVN